MRDIRELDDDYESSKIAPELYMRTRPQMVKQAAILMKQLDEHGYVEASVEPPVAVNAPSVDAQIEAAVQQLRTPQQLDEQLEAAIRQARQKPAVSAAVPANGATLFCPQCGRRLEPDDRFCPKCGHNLVQETNPAQAARA